MTGLLLLFATGMIAAIVIWSIVNDRVGPNDRTTGLLAMRDTESADRRDGAPNITEPASNAAPEDSALR